MSWKEELPDELWRKILEIGVQASNFTYRDLCCVSISCRRLHRLSDEDSLWSHLLSVDFPNQTSLPPSSSSPKSLYRMRFERERERKLLIHNRAVLWKESQVLEHSMKLRENEALLTEEREKLMSADMILSTLLWVSQVSVALNVWQTEVVCARHRQVVEQRVVPVDSRIHSLEMEVKLCNQQIKVFDKAYREEKRRLDAVKRDLRFIKYHPLQDYKQNGNQSHKIKIKRKEKTHRWLKQP